MNVDGVLKTSFFCEEAKKVGVRIDGKKVAQDLRADIKNETIKLWEEKGIRPHLTVVMVGDHPASQTYVRNKEKACAEMGFGSKLIQLEEMAAEKELLSIIDGLNKDPLVHGILVQLPLPAHLNEELILSGISPAKDVDGFHPEQVGRLATGLDSFKPCTAAGIIELLKAEKINIEGKHAVIIGRSNIVGKPLIQLFLEENATVTVCHSHTRNLAEITKLADILVVAIGKPEFLTSEMVQEGAVIVDVGINRLASGKLVGDVDFEDVFDKVSAITPVPGGVGPMTITMLLKNTLKSAQTKN